MGIVVKQSSYNTAIILVGFLIGGITTLFVLPRVFEFDPALLGGLQLLLSYSIIISEFLSFGGGKIAVYYYGRLHKSNNIARLDRLLLYLSVVGAFVMLSTLLFPAVWESLTEEDDFQLSRFLDVLLVLTVGGILHKITTGYMHALLKTTIPTFLKEVLVRVLSLVAVWLYWIGAITFETMLWFYGGVYVLPGLIQLLIIRLSKQKEVIESINESVQHSNIGMLKYGLFAVLDSGAAILINRLDMVMIAAFMPVEHVAYYSIAMFIATVVQIPSRALSDISTGLVSRFWADNELQKIRDVYFKSSLNQMLFGGAFFALIWGNIEQIELFLPAEFRGISYIVLYLGLSKLVNISFGINGSILITSSKYRWNFVFNLILLALTIGTNLILIPQMGTEGAALSTLISVVGFNLLRFAFLWKKFGLQPFRSSHLTGLGMVSGTILIGIFFPDLFDRSHMGTLVQATLQSLGMLLFFSVGLYISRVSEEFNKLVKRFLPLD